MRGEAARDHREVGASAHRESAPKKILEFVRSDARAAPLARCSHAR
jgi:hypothetical protein